MPIEFDGPNSKVSADTIAGQGGSTITIQSGHSLSGSGSGLTALPAANLTGTLPAISGVNLTALNATNLGSGTVPDARFPSTLPAASGANLTALNASNLGSGTVPTARLGTGTASNSTYLRGDNSWATVAAGGGKVLQVLNAVKTDTSSINSTTYADISGLSLTITPSATTSKILFIMNVSAGGAADANHIYLNMVRGSTNILVGDTAGSRTSSTNLVNTQGHGQQITATATYLDSPNTTSATTYKIQWKNNGGATNYINMSTRDNNGSTHDGRVTSQITLMEIGA